MGYRLLLIAFLLVSSCALLISAYNYYDGNWTCISKIGTEQGNEQDWINKYCSYDVTSDKNICSFSYKDARYSLPLNYNLPLSEVNVTLLCQQGYCWKNEVCQTYIKVKGGKYN